MKLRMPVLIVLLSLLAKLNAQVVQLPSEAKSVKYCDYSLENSGFWFSVEGAASTSLILNHQNAQRAELTIGGGYRFNEYLRIGLGLGGNFYFNGNKRMRGEENATTIPVFLNLRGSMISQTVREVVPFWSVNVGTYAGDGVFLSPTIGMRIGEKRNSFLIGICYTLGKMNTSLDNIYPNTVSFLGLKLGYEY